MPIAAVAQPPALPLDEEKLNAFGVRIGNLFTTYKTERAAGEDHWLQNLRQYRGVYDPKIEQMIGKDKSKAYPKLTRWKCVGTVARLMQMLFPNAEKNYAVKESPLPDLSLDQLQEVLDKLAAEKAQASGVDPRDVECTDEEIEKAISQYAAGKARRMEVKIDDDLQEMEYITLARRIVFSAVLYNIGILKGPMHRTVKSRTWQRDANRGGYKAVEKEKYKPFFEFLPVWQYYPDFSAVSLDKQDGVFERHVMIRSEVEALAKRPDFLSARVTKWLHDNREGNHTPETWEESIRSEKKSDRLTALKDTRKYVVAAWYGAVSGHELRAAGITVTEEELGSTFQANVWTIDTTVVKARLLPLGAEVKQHHIFMFEEDDLNLLGNGQCDTLRDSQFAICETARAALDNASVIGPMCEVNDDLLTPGQDVAITKHKTWRREGEGASAQYPAVRDIAIQSHLPDLINLLAVFMDFADKESGLPPPSMGDVSGGGSEALRTQGNASMFLGAAALPIRDTVRNFDTFTTSVISALVAWNKKYDPNPSRDGDFNIIARGSTSLIAKEVLARSLNEFRATVTPDEQPHIKSRALLKARMQVMDLPVDEILEDEAVANQTIKANQERAAQQLAVQMRLTGAQADQFITKAITNLAAARKADGSVNAEMFNAVMDTLQRDHDQMIAAAGAQTDRIKAEAPPARAAA